MEEQEQNYSAGRTISQEGRGSDFPPAPAKKPKSKRNIILAIAIGIGVIIVGMGIVFATGLWDPVWNPLRPSPDKVIMEAINNISNIDRMRTKVELGLEMTDGTEGKTKITVDAKEDRTDPQNPKSQASFDISFRNGGIELVFNGEARAIDNVFYINVTIPLVLTLQLTTYGIDVSPYVGKWYRFDPGEAGMNLALLNGGTESEKIKNEVMDLLKKYPLFKTKSKLRNEKIDGNLAYHYLVAIDPKNAKDFLFNISKIVQEELGSLAPAQTNDEENMKKIADGLERAGEITFEIWIGVKDKYIYKIKGDKNFSVLSTDFAQAREVALNFKVLFSEFNKPQEIIAPENSSNIIDLLMPFLQMWFAGTETGIFYDGTKSCGG